MVFGFAIGSRMLHHPPSNPGPTATDRLGSDVDAVVVLATKIAVALDDDRYAGPLPALPEPDLVRDIARSSPEEAREAVGFLASIRAANLLVARANACPGCVDHTERLRRRLLGHGSQAGLIDRGRVLSAMLRARHPRR
jgi:hypothetical protein